MCDLLQAQVTIPHSGLGTDFKLWKISSYEDIMSPSHSVGLELCISHMANVKGGPVTIPHGGLGTLGGDPEFEVYVKPSSHTVGLEPHGL